MKNCSLIYLLIYFFASCGSNSSDRKDQEGLSRNTETEKDSLSLSGSSDYVELRDTVVEEITIVAPDFPYKGDVGGKTVFMQLDFGEHTISGSYMYEEYLTPIKLEGKYTDDGFILKERDKDNNVTGYFVAHGDFIGFSGKWLKPDEFAKAPVSISHGYRDRRFKATNDNVSADTKNYDWYNIVPSLSRDCEDCISFQSIRDTTYFLRHESFLLKLDKKDSTALFNQDASFRIVPGLEGEGKISVQSHNFPSRYLRLMGNKVELKTDEFVLNLASTFDIKYDFSEVDGSTNFEVGARWHSYDEMPEGASLLHGRIKSEGGTFVSYEFGGDSPYITFRKDGGNTIHFEGNNDDDVRLFRQLSKEEMRLPEYNQSEGYTSNENLIGHTYKIYWAETYRHCGNFDSKFCKTRVIYELKDIYAN